MAKRNLGTRGGLATMAVAILALSAGCGGGGGGGSEPGTVAEFLRAQSLPMMQAPQVTNVGDDAELFSVAFGEAEDCPSGCVYSGGIGLRRGGKVGWLRFDDLRKVDDSGTPLYDLDDSDAALFAPGFRESLRALRDEPRGPFGGHYEAFLDLLARDSETPGDILAGLVDGLSEANYLRARLLVNNPAVRADRGLLVRLANLPVQPPVHDGRDLFQDVREQAAAAAALLP
jgi:hypothetical protein